MSKRVFDWIHLAQDGVQRGTFLKTNGSADIVRCDEILL
jgi:hypothetical protein